MKTRRIIDTDDSRASTPCKPSALRSGNALARFLPMANSGLSYFLVFGVQNGGSARWGNRGHMSQAWASYAIMIRVIAAALPFCDLFPKIRDRRADLGARVLENFERRPRHRVEPCYR